MSQKITTLQIKVPLKSSGGVINQKDITFDLFRDDNTYRLVPCLTEDERRVANLPEALVFTMENNKPVSARGKIDGNFHVIQDAVTLLRKQGQAVL
jgi:hypothetical protein